jgi:flagellar motility protein MotE (MotC chaperone)
MTPVASSSGLRALPVAAAILVLLLGLKLAGLGSEFSELFGFRIAMAAGAAEPDSAKAEPAGAEEHPPEVGHEAEKPKAAEPETGPTASESDVLERLGERRQQLDARERDLDMREKLIGAAEKRVEERVAELKAIEARIEASFGKRDEAEEEKLGALVKLYETMKPPDAAEIFNTLELSVLLDVVGRMKPAKASPIMAAMKPERAQEITVHLARRKSDPELAAVPAEPAPAPEAAPGG